MPGQNATLTFGGDAEALAKAAKRAQASTTAVADSATAVGDRMAQANKKEEDLVTGMAKMAMVSQGLSTAVGDVAGSVQSLADFEQAGKERAAAHARALIAVEQAGEDAAQAAIDLKQATEDLAQAQLDGKQAAADVEQAQLDQQQATLDVTTAQTALTDAVKQHGKNSAEAKQAELDLKQARQDLTQAGLDLEQANRDASQAAIDGTQAVNDQAQAQTNAKTAAQDLADAQREANPTWLQSAAAQIGTYAGIVQGLVGTVGLLAMAHEALDMAQIKSTASMVASKVATVAGTVATGVATAATWLWNAAMLVATSPITLVVLGIGLLVGAVIWLATQTTVFQDTWKVVWTGIKDLAGLVVDGVKLYIETFVGFWSGAWDGIKKTASGAKDFLTGIPGAIGSAFTKIGDLVSAPFRAGFNAAADAWNGTIGKLSWTVPGWVPGLGGKEISAPRLPKFHSGGTVPGLPGQEVLAMLQAGEAVSTSAQQTGAGAPAAVELTVAPGADSALATLLHKLAREGILRFQVRTA